jgi:hypothetical protein
VKLNPDTDWVLALRGVRTRVRSVLPSSFPTPPTTKRRKPSNPPKFTTHPIQAILYPKREVKRESPKPREEGFVYIFCGHAGHLDEFCFRRNRLERRCFEYTRNSYRDEFFYFPPCSYSRASSRTSSRAFPQFSYGSNHHLYGFGSRENHFEPRRFSYDPRPHRDDRFPRRSGFPAGGFHTRFEPRHLDDLHFLHRGSRPTHSNGDVQKIVKTSSGRMVK